MFDTIVWRVILTRKSARLAAAPVQAASLVKIPAIGKSSSAKAVAKTGAATTMAIASNATPNRSGTVRPRGNLIVDCGGL